MSNPSSRQGLIDYALRALGAPVIEINVDEEQLEDRIDEALQFYREYHDDATFRTYLKHQITSTDVSNGYIDIDDSIIQINRMMPVHGSSGRSVESLFDFEYQFRLQDAQSSLGFTSDFAYREQMKAYLNLIDLKTAGFPHITFNRHLNRLYIEGEFSDNSISEGEYVVIEAIKIIDPETQTDIYNDMFLKRYVVALIKRQWGANLIKFEGMQLPGGVTINGREIFAEANDDILRLEEEAREVWEEPIGFMIG